MKTKIAIYSLAVIAVVALTIFAGCSGGSEDSGIPTASVRVMLADAPASAIEELHLRFDGVEIVHVSAPVHTVLDRDDLPADVDVIATGENPLVLGTVDVPAGTYSWANLSIDGNSPVNRVVTTGGDSHPLQYVPPAAETANLAGMYHLQAGREVTLLFNFAAAASVRQSNDGWHLTPQIFSRFVEGPVEFGTLAGTLTNIDEAPVTLRGGNLLGVFLRAQNRKELVDVAEIDTATGDFRLPSVLTGGYQVIVQEVTHSWEPVGEPLVVRENVLVVADQETSIELTADF